MNIQSPSILGPAAEPPGEENRLVSGIHQSETPPPRDSVGSWPASPVTALL